MPRSTDTHDKARRRRRIALGEAIAIAALALSALGLWNNWRTGDDQPAVVVDRAPKPIALVLRGTLEDEGKVMRLAPLEDGHAIDRLTITAAPPGKGSASFGSDPMLSAAMVETWLPKDIDRDRGGDLTLTIVSRYVEAGEPRTATQRYRIALQWKDGGLFGGKSVRLTGLTRS